MSDLVCVARFDNNMEAELAKNALESQGIYAVLSLDENDQKEPIKLVVPHTDQTLAAQILEGSSDTGPDDQSREDAEAAQAEQAEAKKEFDQIHAAELAQKAAGVKKSFTIIGFALAAGLLIYLFGPKGPISPRLALGCLLYSVIELFIALDGLKAAKLLKAQKNNPST